MKKIITGIMVTCFIVSAGAQIPAFEEPVYIYAGGNVIDVGSYGSPFTYDWDGDGAKDLIMGQFDSGKIRFFKNIGTQYNPVFDNGVFLQADGVDITLPYG